MEPITTSHHTTSGVIHLGLIGHQAQLRGLPYDSFLQREMTADIFSVAPGEGQKPIGILSDEHFKEICNPTKYPGGKFGLMSNRKIKLTVRNYLTRDFLMLMGDLPRTSSIY